MRKYIKTLRQQFDNNSVIFKEAKKMFHYVPSNAQHRNYGLNKQQKSRVNPDNQFKDDYSSVKELKNENNDANQSSWIAKLVNGIQDHSLEDVKVPLPKEFKTRLSSVSEPQQKQTSKVSPQKQRPNIIKSQNVIIMTNEDRIPLQDTFNRPLDSLPTKKNSYNFKKKSQISIDKTPKVKTRNSSFGQNIQNKNPKDKVKINETRKQVKKNGTKSQVKPTPTNKEMGPRKKSLQNIYLYRPREQSKFRSSTNNQDELELSNIKITDKATTQKKSTYSNISLRNNKPNQSVLQMEEIKHVASHHEQSVTLQDNTDKNNYLKESLYQPLFKEPKRQSTQYCGDTITKNRAGCGSIRKNSTKMAEINDKQVESIKQESTQAIFSPKFYSTSKLNQAIIEKAEDKDIVTASEQKVLVQKYLKCSKNQQETAAFKSSTYSPTKKDSLKKYKYDINGDKDYVNQNIELISSKNIIHARQPCRQIQQENYFESNFVSIAENENCFDRKITHMNYNGLAELRNHNIEKTNMYRQKPIIYTQKTTDRQAQIRPEIYPRSVRNSKPQTINQSKQGPTINKNPYLQSQSDSLMIESFQASKKKGQYGTIAHNIRTGVPSKYSYIAFNSATREDSDRSYLFSSGEKKTNNTNVDGSDGVIDRLNSKLNLYISQHILKEQSGRDTLNEWKEDEGTHRAMHLNFNQLKKHGEILKR